MTNWSVAASALAFASCWTPQHTDDEWRGHALDRNRVAAEAEDAVAQSLLQPQKPRLSAVPRPGDVLVYIIDVETPGESYRRYLRMTVGGAEDGKVEMRTATITQTGLDSTPRSKTFSSHTLPVLLELFDAEGKHLSESRAKDAMVELLALGFIDSCRAHEESGGVFENVDEAFEVGMLDGPAIFSIGYMLNNNETLYDLAFDLVDTSLVVTALWNFGINFSIEPKYANLERIEMDEITGAPGYRFPVQFRINGRPALRLAATVVDPRAPIGLTAGITRVDGFRPTDDRYRFRVRLVAPGR